MRYPRCLNLLSALVLLTFSNPAVAEVDPFGGGEVVEAPVIADSATIRVTADLIVIPVAACDAMLTKPRKTVDDTDLREQARAMTAKGEASILDTVVLTTRTGQTARNGAIQEFIYATEYEPPELPSPVVDNPPGDDAEAVRTPMTSFTASAFDTKSLGTTWEIKPLALENGKRVDLSLDFSWVGLHGWQIFGKWKDEVVEADLKMPIFYVMDFKARLLMSPGLPVLAGVLSPKGEDGMPDPKRKVLLFVRTEVLNPPDSP